MAPVAPVAPLRVAVALVAAAPQGQAVPELKAVVVVQPVVTAAEEEVVMAAVLLRELPQPARPAVREAKIAAVPAAEPVAVAPRAATDQTAVEEVVVREVPERPMSAATARKAPSGRVPEAAAVRAAAAVTVKQAARPMRVTEARLLPIPAQAVAVASHREEWMYRRYRYYRSRWCRGHHLHRPLGRISPRVLILDIQNPRA